MNGEKGLTLLEVLVASVIMAIAVVGLLSNLTTSMRAAARLTDYDRATMLARTKMDELLAQQRLPINQVMQGEFDPAVAGQLQAGWRGLVRRFETLKDASAGTQALDRVEVEVWWMAGDQRKSFTLDAFKRVVLLPEDLAVGPVVPQPPTP